MKMGIGVVREGLFKEMTSELRYEGCKGARCKGASAKVLR